MQKITKTNVTNLTITYLNINEIQNTVQKHFYLLLRKNRVSCTISMASRENKNMLFSHSSLLIRGGESVSVALWGFVASFSRQPSSRPATPEGSLHKSRVDSVVCICGQLKRCGVVCS